MFIDILSYSHTKEQRIKDLYEIFFKTTTADISTDEKCESLIAKYVTPYIKNWPDDVFFVCDLASQKTIGYLTGCRNSTAAAILFASQLKSYEVFADLFVRFPAHLHINIHPDWHGKGVGSFLIQEYIIELKKYKIKGVHIVTSPDSKNVDFYSKHMFTLKVQRVFNSKNLLFMGKRL